MGCNYYRVEGFGEVGSDERVLGKDPPFPRNENPTRLSVLTSLNILLSITSLWWSSTRTTSDFLPLSHDMDTWRWVLVWGEIGEDMLCLSVTWNSKRME